MLAGTKEDGPKLGTVNEHGVRKPQSAAKNQCGPHGFTSQQIQLTAIANGLTPDQSECIANNKGCLRSRCGAQQEFTVHLNYDPCPITHPSGPIADSVAIHVPVARSFTDTGKGIRVAPAGSVCRAAYY